MNILLWKKMIMNNVECINAYLDNNDCDMCKETMLKTLELLFST